MRQSPASPQSPPDILSCLIPGVRTTVGRMPVTATTAATSAEPSAAVLWVGDREHDELSIAWATAVRVAEMHAVASLDAALVSTIPAFSEQCPAVILLASPTPLSWTLDRCAALSRRWPLAPLVSIATTLVEGRRRSGPVLPGLEEIPWNELSGRLTRWLHDRRRGLAGGLGQPSTARRDERLLEFASRLPDRRPDTPAGVTVSVAASRALDLEGLAEVVTAIGHPIRSRCKGRPPLDDSADVVVWDVASITPAELTWTSLLAAHRPGRAVILLESFPRADTTRAALDAGAAAVLGRPLAMETLSGILLGVAASC